MPRNAVPSGLRAGQPRLTPSVAIKARWIQWQAAVSEKPAGGTRLGLAPEREHEGLKLDPVHPVES